MDCLQLPFIRVVEAVGELSVSWKENLAQKSKFIYEKQI